MKNFITSVSIGMSVGTVFALGFLFIAPHLSDIFAEAFFYSSTETPVTVVQDVTHTFKPSNDQYFIASVDDTISTTTKIVYADLGLMNIALYQEGQKVAEYPIQSVGREGTAWQTPLGTFKMSYKKQNHFSSIGHVWMPYSMHFFGNYFIHGWPYYEGGTPVAQGYSGGCIRLMTPDAEQIFKFLDKDTQLIITTNKKPETKKEFEYQVLESAPLQDVSYLVADIDTGEVIASHNAQTKVSIDSFVKLMTGLISLETINQYQETVYNQDIVPISDVLYPLLLEDSDEAGQVLYEHKNKSQYLIDMNTRAQSLAMNTTKYTDAIGDADTNVSSLENTFKLLQYINLYKPFFINVLSLDEYKKSVRDIDALHPLKGEPEYVAGFSNDAQDELITFVKISKENLLDKKFVIMVHNSTTASSDTKELIEWITTSVRVR